MPTTYTLPPNLVTAEVFPPVLGRAFHGLCRGHLAGADLSTWAGPLLSGGEFEGHLSGPQLLLPSARFIETGWSQRMELFLATVHQQAVAQGGLGRLFQGL